MEISAFQQLKNLLVNQINKRDFFIGDFSRNPRKEILDKIHELDADILDLRIKISFEENEGNRQLKEAI